MTTYPLGRRVNHDPRSWNYRVTHDSAARTTVRWDRLVPVLDQGQLGSCTGNAGTGVLGTQPYYSGLTGLTPVLDENYAVQLYSDASKVDGDPDQYPPTDTGSDGLSVAKVLKTRGLISGYQHAFGIDDAFAAIQSGPLMVGTDWYTGMFHPDETGQVYQSGSVAGGHEYECIGYDATTDLWEFVNSWGTSWARAGHFFMTTTTFDRLLQRQGDLILLTPLMQPAPTPTPTPVQSGPSDADLRLLDGWALGKHVGANGKAAQAWKRVRPYLP